MIQNTRGVGTGGGLDAGSEDLGDRRSRKSSPIIHPAGVTGGRSLTARYFARSAVPKNASNRRVNSSGCSIGIQ
jgi:hypothetical protein